jgi:hypothetical protein
MSRGSSAVPGTQSVPMVNGRGWAFTFGGWNYQIVCLNGSEKVRLSYRTAPGEPWQHGHTRETNGASAASVARTMYATITGGVASE